eukprot:CAMPEP_0113662920 /NCGR_PEP_ID=MMETSP0038_2-20120614/844_1 /TAXON_ID=2898 /ORGANISM="Cryptomonas paramecium" /LENGTH=136 /DNA_ID=CAMNT_0000577869 /DNA_START=121 /DNA_END=531 /DNA_ORIENTATION=+ /assembly_acc=CAM_ASM_000170
MDSQQVSQDVFKAPAPIPPKHHKSPYCMESAQRNTAFGASFQDSTVTRQPSLAPSDLSSNSTVSNGDATRSNFPTSYSVSNVFESQPSANWIEAFRRSSSTSALPAFFNEELLRSSSICQPRLVEDRGEESWRDFL